MITVFVLNLEASANLYNLDLHWMPSHPNEKTHHIQMPTWLDQAPTSASREAFHPSGIFHAFSRMRFLHFHDSRHPLISLATTPWQRVDVVTGHQLVISNPRFARHLRPLPCHSSLSIEGMKGQCHVASLTWWNDVMRNVKNSRKLEKRSCRPVRSGMFLLAFVPAFDFTDWGTNTMARSRSAVLVTWVTCSKLQMWSQVLQSVLQYVAIAISCEGNGWMMLDVSNVELLFLSMFVSPTHLPSIWWD